MSDNAMHIRLRRPPWLLMMQAGGHLTEVVTPTKHWLRPLSKTEGAENCHTWRQGGRGRLSPAGACYAAVREPLVAPEVAVRD